MGIIRYFYIIFLSSQPDCSVVVGFVFKHFELGWLFGGFESSFSLQPSMILRKNMGHVSLLLQVNLVLGFCFATNNLLTMAMHNRFVSKWIADDNSNGGMFLNIKHSLVFMTPFSKIILCSHNYCL